MGGTALLTKYTCKGGETMADIAKLHKIKDIKPILAMKENRKAAEMHKKKVSFPKGMVIFLPDPKVKLYQFKGPKGVMYLTEKDWKDARAKLMLTMKKGYVMLDRACEVADTYYDGQKKVNDEFPVVAFMCSTWVGSKGKEPVAERKAAHAQLRKLGKVAQSGKFALFEPQMRITEKAINLYRTRTMEWIDKLIGSSGNWISGLTITRDVSFVVFSAAATTVVAPVGAVAVVATGAGVGAGSSFLKSGANEVGRVIAGENVTMEGAGKKILKDTLLGAAFGAGGAGFAKWVAGPLLGKLTERLVAAPMAGKVAGLIARGSVKVPILDKIMARCQRVYMPMAVDSIIKKMGVKVSEKGAMIALETVEKELATIAAENIKMMIIRMGSGGLATIARKHLTGDKKGKAAMATKKRALNSKSKVDENKLADMVADDLKKDPVVFSIYADAIKKGASDLEKSIQEDIRKRLEAELKKQAK